MDRLEQIKYKGYNINIYQDSDPESPREWCNIGKMLCFHNRYNLGDEDIKDEWIEKLECKVKDVFDYCDEKDLIEWLKKEKKAVVILPLFLYDHSGISMRCYPHGQHVSWDCGQVGFIYVTKEDIKKEYGNKKVTKKEIEKILTAEVKTYSQYIEGSVYGYMIEKNEDEEGRGEQGGS